MTYFTENYAFHRHGKEGVDVLTNFVAKIDKEIIYHDGAKTTTHLEISGEMAPLPPPPDDPDAPYQLKPEPEPRKLPSIVIPASDFASLGWVAEKWGMQPIIFPVPSGERDLRTAIQLLSVPSKTSIYTHTGWTIIKDKPHFLTMSGGINARGLDSTIQVHLPAELTKYRLPEPSTNKDAAKEAFLASVRIINTGPPAVLWPLLLATYRAAIRPADFALHLAGKTGTFKSEITSLFQSHYGSEMDARHLPASWSSTANALEHLAYRAKDCIMALDDFVPTGTAWQVRQLQKSADQIIRAQGNQAGRSRLTDTTAMQTTYYPRGMILSTGEDIPEGHSIRGRMMILELSPGAISPASLTTAQMNRPHYAQAMSDWIHWLAKNPQAKEDQAALAAMIRDEYLQVGHTRTPPIIGELIATARLIGEYAKENDWLPQLQINAIIGKARKAVIEAGNQQKTYLEAADPVEAFLETIRNMMQSNQAHAKTVNGGIPVAAELWGWTKKQKQGELASYESNGPTIGYINADEGEFLFDPGSIQFIKKFAGGRLALTNQTLTKRIKEAGILTRVDDARNRFTIRKMVDGHYRALMAISLPEIKPEAGE